MISNQNINNRDLDTQAWNKKRIYTPENLSLARQVLGDIQAGRKLAESVKRHPLPDGGYIGKHMLVAAYRQLVRSGELVPDEKLLTRIRMKPVRTLSGVTTVSVLTKPYSCPGECIFCPSDIRMPKSYVPGEPGARRALEHKFDPFSQVTSRIEALEAVGHPTDKVELLVLGGTWTAYPREYQSWFIQRCFDAMNGRDSINLEEAHTDNEMALHRNVGLTVELRPDHVNPEEIIWFRQLGVTKVQMGIQSLDDHILELNQRGHSLKESRVAVDLLRAGGYKIVLHWMPNLLGATIESDRIDFSRLWSSFCPDEIKIYPNQLLECTKLYQNWLRGEFTPYSTEQLVELLADIKETIPRYCRVNRVIRDIPSTYVVEGNKRTSLRQDVHKLMELRGRSCQCIRCREIRNQQVDLNTLAYHDLVYKTSSSEEHFLSYDTQEDYLAGFLRLSLPGDSSPNTGIEELRGVAIIREVHIYGQSLPVGVEEAGAAQHIGLGTYLIKEAEDIARTHGFHQLAVISAIGTRTYYQKQGFERGNLYMIKRID